MADAVDWRPLYRAFAERGDREDISDEANIDGSVSYAEGYGFDYERNPALDVDARPIERRKMNSLFNVISALCIQFQNQGFPEWYQTETTSSRIKYPKGSIVRYSGSFYQSLIDDNTASPDAADRWVEIMFPSRNEYNEMLKGVAWQNKPNTFEEDNLFVKGAAVTLYDDGDGDGYLDKIVLEGNTDYGNPDLEDPYYNQIFFRHTTTRSTGLSAKEFRWIADTDFNAQALRTFVAQKINICPQNYVSARLGHPPRRAIGFGSEVSQMLERTPNATANRIHWSQGFAVYTPQYRNTASSDISLLIDNHALHIPARTYNVTNPATTDDSTVQQPAYIKIAGNAFVQPGAESWAAFIFATGELRGRIYAEDPTKGITDTVRAWVDRNYMRKAGATPFPTTGNEPDFNVITPNSYWFSPDDPGTEPPDED